VPAVRGARPPVLGALPAFLVYTLVEFLDSAFFAVCAVASHSWSRVVSSVVGPVFVDAVRRFPGAGWLQRTRLRSVRALFCGFSHRFSALLLADMPRLATLELASRSCSGLGEMLRRVASCGSPALAQLTSLTLRRERCGRLTVGILRRADLLLALAALGSLTSLSIDCCLDGSLRLSGLPFLRNLRCLRVPASVVLTVDDAAAVSPLETLDADGHHHFAFFSSPALLHTLTSLSLRGWNGREVLALLPPGLESLDLSSRTHPLRALAARGPAAPRVPDGPVSRRRLVYLVRRRRPSAAHVERGVFGCHSAGRAAPAPDVAASPRSVARRQRLLSTLPRPNGTVGGALRLFPIRGFHRRLPGHADISADARSRPLGNCRGRAYGGRAPSLVDQPIAGREPAQATRRLLCRLAGLVPLLSVLSTDARPALAWAAGLAPLKRLRCIELQSPEPVSVAQVLALPLSMDHLRCRGWPDNLSVFRRSLAERGFTVSKSGEKRHRRAMLVRWPQGS